MSRSWERQVAKNKKQVNKQRVKHGQPRIEDSPKEQVDTFYGRSWFLPALMVAISAFFGTVSFAFSEDNTFTWVMIVLYLFLGVMYYLRRPYVKVGKHQIATKKMGMERVLRADEMDSISIQSGSVAIKVKGKKSRWVFTKFQNLYDIPAIAAKLKVLAQQNQIPYEENGVSAG